MSASLRGRPVKTKIKPPRKQGDVSVDDIWAQLARNIREIHAHNAFKLSFEENHRFGYNIVLAGRGDMLYKGVKQLITENLDRLANEQVIPAFPTGDKNDVTEQSDERTQLLKALRNVWEDHQGNMSKLRDILKYLDRVYAKKESLPEVWDAGMNLFLQRILRSPIKDHLISAVLSEIRVEREGYVIHRSDMKGCVDVLLALSESDDQPSVYKRDLEPAVLRESEAFYRAESEQLLETCDASEYLTRVEARLEAEEARAVHYLSTHTAAPLQNILQENLLLPHLNTILNMSNSGLDVMIDTDKTDSIGRVYRLFALVPDGLPTLRRALKESANRRGRAVNTVELPDAQEEEDTPEFSKGKGKGKAPVQTAGAQILKLALQWVEDVLALKDKFDNILRNALQSDRELESGLNEAFDSFINANEKSPEYISLFIDDHLKKGLKGKSDAEVEIVLDKTITVFRYVTEKDVFERYYKSHLAKRLLSGRSVSDDAERGMLAKLKIECGYQFTQKLEGMFHDMKLSDETMRDYSSYLQNMGPQSLDLSVTVMTSTFWPMSHSAAPCSLPTQLVNVTKTFERFYLGRHTGRRLTWQPALGNADVRVKFKAKKHDLNVSTYALVVLLLFEDLGDEEFLTYDEIKNATAIQESELQRNLQSLACAKWKILKKHPPGRDVNPSDSFSFNADFTSPLQKIKISTVAAKVENSEERKETRDRVDEERKHQTDACIVRIMKDRKHMTHNDLINEVTRQLASRFQPNPLQIKKRIESLIEREYLERCDYRKSYNYMA